MSLLYVFFVLCFSSALGDFQIYKVVDPVIHGEGPHWDSDKQVLYYVDILNQTVNKYDPKTDTVKQTYIESGPVGFVIPDKVHPKKFVVGNKHNVIVMTWDGESPKPEGQDVIATVEQDKTGNRFNDGKADASGRLWAGTMGPENPDLKPFQGTLYSFDWKDEFKPVVHLTPVSVSNGIAWNKNDSLMYYIDTPTRVVTVFDFDIDYGKISNRRDLFSFDANNITGFPDGMTIDENDNLWVAVYKGSSVLHIDTIDGKLLKKIEFPVTLITSCAFGGENLEDLYVTSSRTSLSEEEVKKQPLAGALFKLTGLGVRGQVKPNTFSFL